MGCHFNVSFKNCALSLSSSMPFLFQVILMAGTFQTTVVNINAGLLCSLYITGIKMKLYLYRMPTANSSAFSGLSHFLCGDVLTNNKSNNQSFLHDSCVINYVQLLPHTVFIIISISILVIMSHFCRKQKKPFLIRSPGHNIRWSLFLILLILLVFQIEEGLLSDIVVSTEASSQPDLYIPAIVAFIGGVTAAVYFHHAECWQQPSLCILLILYWSCALICDCLILINLNRTDHMTINVMRWDMTILRASLYAVFLFLDLFVLGSWVSLNLK